jgi:hypothetical protein
MLAHIFPARLRLRDANDAMSRASPISVLMYTKITNLELGPTLKPKRTAELRSVQGR